MISVAVTRKIGLISAVVLFVLAGCRQSIDVSQPPEIIYGQDSCDSCRMLINEENLAAAYWTDDGKARRFDDIGGMLAYQQETGDEVAAWWVHDFTSGDWLKAKDAHFVIGAGAVTPMGFDIVAFADQSAAMALSYGVDGAMVLDFSGLQEQAISRATIHDSH